MSEDDFSSKFELALHDQLKKRQQRDSNITPIYTRKQIEQAFLETFELVGGVPRFALWANEERNYGKFIELYLRLAPKDVPSPTSTGSVIEYRSNVPASSLNRAPVQIEQLPDE